MEPHLQHLYERVRHSSGICFDSRKARVGEIFFALQGDTGVDGNQFAQTALDNGCTFAVIDNPDYAVRDKTILVEHVLESLHALAHYHRSQFNIPVIGITGSNGKTTTKNIIASMCTAKYGAESCLVTQGNFNSKIGLPIVLLQLKPQHRIAIIEMGASELHDIRTLCNLAQPTHGIITNISKAHIGEFGSFENIVATKTELYEWISNNNGVALVHVDDVLLMEKSTSCARKTYSIHEKTTADTSVIPLRLYPTLEMNWHGHTVRSCLFGEHNAINCAAALCVADVLGINPEHALGGIGSAVFEENRSQIIKNGDLHIFLDAYNANPASMRIACDSFQAMTQNAPERTYIVGGMKELGKYSNDEHRAFIEYLQDHRAENTYFVGEEFVQNKKEDFGTYFASTEDLQEYLSNHPLTGWVFVKGSRSYALENLFSQEQNKVE